MPRVRPVGPEDWSDEDPVKRALIGGIGNVLLGDDSVGPYVVRMLESQYEFGPAISLVDLGTPALDLTHQIVGLHSLILVDAVASDDPAGTLTQYRREDILGEAPQQRLDPHSPALSECLLTAEMLGAMPENVLLIGITAKAFEPGEPLSAAVRDAASAAIHAVVEELLRLGFEVRKKQVPDTPSIWWSRDILPREISPSQLCEFVQRER